MSVTCGRSMVFSDTPVFCINKTDHHDITEIFLKMALNTMTGLHKLFSCKFQVNLSVKNGYLFYFFLCWFLLLMITGSLNRCRFLLFLNQCRFLLFVYTCIVVWYPIIIGVWITLTGFFLCLSQILVWCSVYLYYTGS